jgi:hypothetical protein
MHVSNRCNLRVNIADWTAESATLRDDFWKSPCGLALKTKDASHHGFSKQPVSRPH